MRSHLEHGFPLERNHRDADRNDGLYSLREGGSGDASYHRLTWCPAVFSLRIWTTKHDLH